ncbi:MAG TPA: hypothetical protein VKP30_07375 [Polyangiaceae bacterium]|nr:hypothetical protein [Polyangiaceae bacterium]
MMPPDDTNPDDPNTFAKYVRVLAALAQPGVDADTVLARFGLTEAEWDALEDACDARLNSEDNDDEKTLGYLGQIAQGLHANHSSTDEPGIDFDTWLAVTRACRTGAQFEAQLATRKIALQDFLSAQAHWIQRMAGDPALLARYRSNG